MLVDACLPASFWGETIILLLSLLYVHVRNRMPCSSNAGSASPYEIRDSFSSSPGFKLFQTFYRDMFSHEVSESLWSVLLNRMKISSDVM